MFLIIQNLTYNFLYHWLPSKQWQENHPQIRQIQVEALCAIQSSVLSSPNLTTVVRTFS